MTGDSLYYYLYRGNSSHNKDLIEAVIEEIKNYVFEGRGLLLSAQGYSGIPLQGETPIATRKEDLWKIIDILFKLSIKFEGLVFRISTDVPENNLFYHEAVRNEVLPKWFTTSEDFNKRVYGCGGILHIISPEAKVKFWNTLDVDIIRSHHRDTRNILITEAVKQKLLTASSRNFGMQRASVNLPVEIAYISKQRPELLSAAIREYMDLKYNEEDEGRRISDSDRVMVHVFLNSRDWKDVTAVADIESPCDIVSHRITNAMLEFDRKHSSIQNGVHVSEDNQFFKNVTDSFERERLNFLLKSLFTVPKSYTHTYQMAKRLVSEKHLAECKKLFADGMSSSSETRDSVCSGDDEREYKNENIKRQVFKKKRQLGKKKVLASIVMKNNVPLIPSDNIEEVPTPTSSGQLRNFERAVNGDDIYKESSDERSLGEEEDLDLFITKPKPKEPKKSCAANLPFDLGSVSEDDCGFDVPELLHTLPPIAHTDEFEDFSDI